MFSERIRLSLAQAAQDKSEADRLEAMSKRIYAQLIVNSEGSVSFREYLARQHDRYVAIEDQLLEAKTRANLSKAHADALQLAFEEWRSIQSTAREEMKLK